MQVHIPAILISVSEFRVEDPTAVNRLADWSVRWLQWLRSSRESAGMWRMMSRSVASVISSPANRKSIMLRSLLRLSWPIVWYTINIERAQKPTIVYFSPKLPFFILLLIINLSATHKLSGNSCFMQMENKHTGFIWWRCQQVPNLRILDSYCPPKIEGPEKGAGRGTESRYCWPGAACQDEVFEACWTIDVKIF